MELEWSWPSWGKRRDGYDELVEEELRMDRVGVLLFGVNHTPQLFDRHYYERYRDTSNSESIHIRNGELGVIPSLVKITQAPGSPRRHQPLTILKHLLAY